MKYPPENRRPAVEEFGGTLEARVDAVWGGPREVQPTMQEMGEAIVWEIKQEAEEMRSYLEVAEEERRAWQLYKATEEVHREVAAAGSGPQIIGPTQSAAEEEQRLTGEKIRKLATRRTALETDDVQQRLQRIKRLRTLLGAFSTTRKSLPQPTADN